ncbi:MAG: ATPase, T2SS/T4P/T4SS family [Candidatus Woesearchaeota archaeon]
MAEQGISYQLVRRGEDAILYFDCEKWSNVPVVEDQSRIMAISIEKLQEVRGATKIIFSQRREYEYDYEQTMLLYEIARLHATLTNDKQYFSLTKYASTYQPSQRIVGELLIRIQQLMLQKIKEDPLAVYVELKRLHRKIAIDSKNATDSRIQVTYQSMNGLVEDLLGKLEHTKLIAQLKHQLAAYHLGDRTLYKQVFAPVIRPDFMYTKLMASYPQDGQEVGSFIIGDDVEVTIFKVPNQVQYLYHVNAPEFRLSDEKYDLLDSARTVMAEHKPERGDFVDPQRMREVFFNVGYDLIRELAQFKSITLAEDEHVQLTNILLRYTVGFGLVEVLLQDEQMQDISVNSPQGNTPIFIVHGLYDECVTNIMPTTEEAESWATKLRLMSGRSLDEADPILDTEIEFPFANVRVAAVTEPLNPTGLAFSFRRHRNRPWTLPLFIKYKTITPLAAGLLSFLIDGTRTMLIAGTRSSGKSSLLSSVLVEIMRRYRIITIEDTLELPTTQMRKLGFNIQPLKVASSLGSGHTNEMSAESGIRSTLRLGDSALIVGEVRSGEAKALYEAMRVGAAANVVAGTIHGDSPYGIFDRVVNDIGVPKTSFKATDIIVIANPIRSADGLHKFRRVLSITEVRKDWTDDPHTEHGFIDLMKYNSATDQLEPTDALLNGDSDILKLIAGNIKEMAGKWDNVWENIQLRARIKEAIVDIAQQEADNELLEAEFVIACNDEFHRLYEKFLQKTGPLDNDALFFEWKEWVQRQVRKRKLALEST